MLADVAQAQGSEDRIDDRVDHDVPVRMRDGRDPLGHDDPAHDKLPAIPQAVNVVAVTDAESISHRARSLARSFA